MMLFGVFWAAFAPLLLLAALAGLAWVFRRFAPGRLGWRGALLAAAIVLGAPLGWIWRQDAAVGCSRFCSGPITRAIDVTISSRIASSGGLVTCAKSSTK